MAAEILKTREMIINSHFFSAFGNFILIATSFLLLSGLRDQSAAVYKGNSPDDKDAKSHTLRTVHQHGEGILIILVRKDGDIGHHRGQEVDLNKEN